MTQLTEEKWTGAPKRVFTSPIARFNLKLATDLPDLPNLIKLASIVQQSVPMVPASNNDLDMFAEMRQAAILAKGGGR